jgi:ribosomal protein S18 acetylase RimI-like enzyme
MRAVQVEACVPTDADLIADLGWRTFEETYAADTSKENMERHLAEAYAPDQVRRELTTPGSRFFVARVGDVPAGYLKVNTGDAQTELKEAAGLEIEALYVSGEFQGRGIGGLLLEKALGEAEAVDADYVWLGVWERNVKGRRFWERMGFVEFGAHPFRFGGIEHTDVMMKRELKPA